MFREAADIKTADQLHLPTPEAVYHNVVAKPTEMQKDMVEALSKRAAEVHAGVVNPKEDNMLKITSDGRKLGLDQRILNPLLPDDERSKVNQCVEKHPAHLAGGRKRQADPARLFGPLHAGRRGLYRL